MARNTISRSNLSYEEKKDKFMAITNHSPKSVSNKQSQDYMSDPNTIKFTDALIKRSFNSTGIGRPYAFESVERLEEDINEYIKLCYDTSTIPTVSSASLWLGVNRDTLYAHSNNSNSPFSDTCKNLINVCHVCLENGAIKNKVNSVLFMFLGKNYFGLKDDKNITVSAQQGSDVNSQETAEALRKQLEEETTPNAEVISEK